MIRTDTSPLPTSTDLSQTQERETTLAFNVFKGLAILEVVIHHSSGMALRFLQSESLLYGVLAFINRTLHFAVPAFLFMSALLLARSALGKPFKVRTFLERRFVRSALPYVVWTVLYTLFKVVTTPLTFPEILKLESWIYWLRYGKAYYHLYFLTIALQFYLLFPLLLPLFRLKLRFFPVLFIALAAQLVVALANRWLSDFQLNFQFPATMVWWYLPSILLGMYFGARYARFYQFWQRYYLLILAATALFGYAYVNQAYALLAGESVNNLLYNGANWLYTTAMALVLLGVSHSFVRGRLGTGPVALWFSNTFEYMGRYSLQIYLIHPALLFFFGQWGFPGNSFSFVLTLVAYMALAIVGPLLLARGLEKINLSGILFGGR